MRSDGDQVVAAGLTAGRGQKAVLRALGLGVSFGGHHAVQNVTTEFQARSLTAIVGPNGAGKTTLFNLISGQLRSTSGEVWLDGSNISALSAAQRARQGIGRAFQLTNLFPKLSVLENVRLTIQANRGGKHRRGLNLWSIWSDFSELTDSAMEILARVGLARRSQTVAATLPHGDQRKLEVALLIAMDPKVFMFDEPTAGMSADEAPVILDLIRALKKRSDKTILLVEHKMDVVRELADRVIVMHNGGLVADGLPADVIASPIVQQAYLGVSVPRSAGLQ